MRFMILCDKHHKVSPITLILKKIVTVLQCGWRTGHFLTLCDVHCEVPWISLCHSLGHVWVVITFPSYYQDIIECDDKNQLAPHHRNDSHNCHADANCTNTKGSFYCTCYSGYSGDGIVCSGKFQISKNTVWSRNIGNCNQVLVEMADVI